MAKIAVIFILILLDGALGFLALVTAWGIQYREAMVSAGGNFGYNCIPYVPLLIVAPIARVLLSWHSGGYRLRGAFARSEEAAMVFRTAVQGSVILILTAGLVRTSDLLWIARVDYGHVYEQARETLEPYLRSFHFSRVVFLNDFLLYLLFALLFRILWREVQLAVRRRGKDLIPVIIVGDEGNSREIMELVENTPRLGRRLVRFINGAPEKDEEILHSELINAIQEEKAEEIIFAGSGISHPKIFRLIMDCELARPIDVKLLPDLSELVTRKLELTRMGEVPVLALMGDPIGRANRILKRSVDVLSSSFLLLLLSPVMIATAFLVKVTSRGPIIFRQKRVGMDGRVFTCFKFRSMYHDTQNLRHKERSKEFVHGTYKEIVDRTGAVTRVYKDPYDSRITPVGRFIRRYSLDELPQIWNVLRGDMSLIGPRPPVPEEVAEYDEWHRLRLATRPGVTGLWQVSGRNRLSFDEMVKLDIYYIENYSLWFDLRILILTVPAVFKGSGF